MNKHLNWLIEHQQIETQNCIIIMCRLFGTPSQQQPKKKWYSIGK